MGRPTEVRVRVPGSSANLGPGFDSLGLALSLYDEIEVSVDGHDDVHVEIAGEGAGQVPCDESHLVVSTMRTTWALLGEEPPAGLRMRCRNAIPHSRGLGSSASAAVAGAVAAAVLAGRDLALEQSALLQVTAGIEGHADNAAASLMGGFVVAWETAGNTADRFHAIRLETHPDIHPVALVPQIESSTKTTRGLLPERVPLADAAFTGSRTALSVLAFTQQPDLLLAATEDRLHQGYRRPAYPESADLVDALRARGVPATISGAGPTVLALTSDARIPDDVDLTGFATLVLPVDIEGAQVEIG
ncbi:MAG: homoserine kinase [Pseudonocardia sp.]|uniref:homoserine kinase n=1 Tax=Pseudonocardia sp. TaxID=60912 RepID=UPI001ACFF1BA|nr:homoserine kinase [Pseudonocardia sp.]MBN9109944.1 homoserine kinase [Pseudonocardia sp.]